MKGLSKAELKSTVFDIPLPPFHISLVFTVSEGKITVNKIILIPALKS